MVPVFVGHDVGDFNKKLHLLVNFCRGGGVLLSYHWNRLQLYWWSPFSFSVQIYVRDYSEDLADVSLMTKESKVFLERGNGRASTGGSAFDKSRVWSIETHRFRNLIRAIADFIKKRFCINFIRDGYSPLTCPFSWYFLSVKFSIILLLSSFPTHWSRLL